MWLFALPALLINVFIILIPAALTFAAAFVVWDGVGTPVGRRGRLGGDQRPF